MTYPTEKGQSPDPVVRLDNEPGRVAPAREPARAAAEPRLAAPSPGPELSESTPVGMRATPPTDRGYANAADVSGLPLTEVVYWFALALAAAADIAAFHQVVSLVMREQGDTLVWLMVVGLTVIALTLAHFAGRLARDVSARHGTATWKQFLLCAIPWVALGLAAFAVRLIVADSSGGTTVDGTIIGADSVGRQARQTSAAVLFLALYVGSGAVAAFGAYFTRNPLRSGYRQAMRAHTRALDRLRRSQPPYERALQVYRQRARIRAREEANWQAARELRLAQADELKRYAAVLIAAHLQDPSVTDAMTLPDRRPITGANETTLGHEARNAINARSRTETPTAGPRKTAQRPTIGFLRRSAPKRAIEARPVGGPDSPQRLDPGRETSTESGNGQADGPVGGGRKAG
jgi:hypothetical protein